MSTLFEFVELIGNRFGLLRGVGPESESERVRSHGRRVPKVGPEVKSCRWRAEAAEQGSERRTWALPDVSGGENAMTEGGNGHRLRRYPEGFDRSLRHPCSRPKVLLAAKTYANDPLKSAGSVGTWIFEGRSSVYEVE